MNKDLATILPANRTPANLADILGAEVLNPSTGSFQKPVCEVRAQELYGSSEGVYSAGKSSSYDCHNSCDCDGGDGGED